MHKIIEYIKNFGLKHIIVVKANTIEGGPKVAIADAVRLSGYHSISEAGRLRIKIHNQYPADMRFVFNNHKSAMAFRLRWAGEVSTERWH